MPNDNAYVERRPGRTRLLPIRNLHYQLREWGDPSLVAPERPVLVFTHGWMDVGASFQFIVDELDRLEGGTRHVVAIDWRGFGGSTSGGVDAYWFHDYVGDLDAVLDALSPDAPVDLVGHSMGGNVVMNYAGVRPARVRRLVNLEGFGLPDMKPEHAPDRLARWLDELKSPPSLRSYDSVDDVAARLRANNPRLAADKAAWLAPHWADRGADGRWHLLADPAHKLTNPVAYRAAEIVASWRRIAAPVLWVEGADTDVTKYWGSRYPRAEFEQRLANVPRVERLLLDDCGHMLHHDQPAAVAARLLRFLD
ncbi:MAG: alpha/beta hydrolase [Burkholderiales bacterium]|nr:alpha/beta hydrolase [Burkholderiales bacterium]